MHAARSAGLVQSEPLRDRGHGDARAVLPDERLATLVREHFDLRPAAIIKTLSLKRPIYRPTAAYGHFGRPAERELFTWERTDQVESLKRAASRL